MRLLAIILNVILIGTVIFIILSPKNSHMESGAIAMVALLLSVPIANLLTFYFSSNSESWISLYFRRKAMEEKAKISSLNDKNS